MPSQDDLLKSISGTKLGNTIAEKIAAGQDMDTILKDEKISKERNEHYKKLFDKWETKFDRSIGKIYNAYKLGKYPNLTPMQKKSLELLKDMQ